MPGPRIAGGEFGRDVAVSGNYAVVSSQNYLSSSRGQAVVFQRDGGGWKQVHQFPAPLPGDGFGTAVAISGSTVVIGAFNPKSGLAGEVYVSSRTGSGWSATTPLMAPTTGGTDDAFGTSVAIAGKVIVAGARYANGTGKAYIFSEGGKGWTQTGALPESGAAPVLKSLDDFGVSVAIIGTTIVVGADDAYSNVGRAYVFQQSDGRWALGNGGTLQPPGTPSGGHFGASVAASNTVVVVGAADEYGSSGRAYVFQKLGDGWSQAKSLVAKEFSPKWHFGKSVAISGPAVVVGADTVAGTVAGIGAVYIFMKPAGSAEWPQVAERTGDSGSVAGFGRSVAIDGTDVVVGAPSTGRSIGAAYTFQL
jgi:hypothetical protein